MKARDGAFNSMANCIPFEAASACYQVECATGGSGMLTASGPVAGGMPHDVKLRSQRWRSIQGVGMFRSFFLSRRWALWAWGGLLVLIAMVFITVQQTVRLNT